MYVLIAGVSILFFLILESVIFFPERYVFSFFSLLLLLISGRIGITRGSSRGDVLIPFFCISSWLLLFFVDDVEKQHIFSILLSCLFFFVLLVYYRWQEGQLVGVAKGVVSSVTVITAFLFFSVSIGVAINYALPIWISMICIGGGSYLLMRQYLSGITKENMHTRRYSIAVGLFFAELGWFVQFWPFGYLTTGVILLILYYVLWDVLSSYIEGVFTRLRAWGDILVLVILVSMVLLTTPWIFSQ